MSEHVLLFRLQVDCVAVGECGFLIFSEQRNLGESVFFIEADRVGLTVACFQDEAFRPQFASGVAQYCEDRRGRALASGLGLRIHAFDLHDIRSERAAMGISESSACHSNSVNVPCDKECRDVVGGWWCAWLVGVVAVSCVDFVTLFLTQHAAFLLIPGDFLYTPVTHRRPFCRNRLLQGIIPIPRRKLNAMKWMKGVINA